MIARIAASVIEATGKIRSLIALPEPAQQITEEQVTDAVTLSRMLGTMLRKLASLERRPCPRRIDHEDVVVDGTGSTQYPLAHGFGGRVRWWVTDATAYAVVERDASASTDDVLVLLSHHAATITVRIEEVGG